MRPCRMLQARALVAGEFVELPPPAGSREEAAGLGADSGWVWAGSGAGGGAAPDPQRPELVPSGGANPGMLLHSVHARWGKPQVPKNHCP